jgi:hypothetical protein
MFEISMCWQFIIVQFLNKFAATVKLSAKWWGVCIAIGFMRYVDDASIRVMYYPSARLQWKLS